jgi:6-pyruvoyltetrahydropterin/6-carboxytetrahydropterin synthase
MERWSIDLYKEYFKFSAAHFLIFPDGSAERLHGHNYRVFVEIEAELTRHGLVLDFKQVKPVVRELVDSLDEHWLIPGEHPVLSWKERDDGVCEVRYLERYYAAPREDVIVLPINNTSSETLATCIGRELHRR